MLFRRRFCLGRRFQRTFQAALALNQIKHQAKPLETVVGKSAGPTASYHFRGHPKTQNTTSELMRLKVWCLRLKGLGLSQPSRTRWAGISRLAGFQAGVCRDVSGFTRPFPISTPNRISVALLVLLPQTKPKTYKAGALNQPNYICISLSPYRL